MLQLGRKHNFGIGRQGRIPCSNLNTFPLSCMLPAYFGPSASITPLLLIKILMSNTDSRSLKSIPYRCAAVTMDLSTLVPTQAPPWYLGNYVTAVPVSVVSTGDSNDGAHLGITMSPALARTIRAIRAAIIDARSPAKLRHALTLPFEDRMSSTGFLASLARAKATGIDAVFTNWNHSSHETMDFGRGPPASLNGHFGIQQCNLVGIVGLADSAYGIRLPFSSKEAKQRLQGSRVLSDIREFSDLLGA